MFRPSDPVRPIAKSGFDCDVTAMGPPMVDLVGGSYSALMSVWRTTRPWVIGLGCTALACGLFVLMPALVLVTVLILGSKRTIYERQVSPDGWREARVQFDDAGAISNFDRIVLIKWRWNPSDEPLLSCRAFLADGENPVHLRWLGNHTLEIEQAFPPQAIEAQATHCGSVKIVVRRFRTARPSS